jgi:hypothetical protein
MYKTTLSRIGAVLSLFALTALPLASCGTASFTGVDVLFELEGAALHKLLVGVAIVTAALGIFLVTRRAQIGLGAAGLAATLVAAWMVIGDGSDDTQVQFGAWVAVLGFALMLAAGLMQPALPASRARTKTKSRRKR